MAPLLTGLEHTESRSPPRAKLPHARADHLISRHYISRAGRRKNRSPNRPIPHIMPPCSRPHHALHHQRASRRAGPSSRPLMIRSEQQENGDWHGFIGELPIARSKRPPRRSRSTGCGRSKAPSARGDGEAHRASDHMVRHPPLRGWLCACPPV